MPGANRALGLQIVDPVLTNLARRYQAHGFIYDQVVSPIGVQTLSGQYPVFPKSYWFQNEVDNETKDRAPVKEIDFEFSTEPFLCHEYGFKVSITELEREQANAALKLEQAKTDFLSLRMAIAREVRLANLLRDTAHGGGLTSGNETGIGTKWDNTSSNPESDIRAASLNIYNTIGYNPNLIIIPYPVAYNLATIHGADTFRGQMLYTVNGTEAIRIGSGVLPSEIHGMKVVIPMGPQVSTSAEGATTPTYSEVWGKHVRLLYADPNAPWGTPTVVNKFSHTPTTVRRWSVVDPDVDYIREMERCVEQVVAPDAGWVLTAAIT